jgi:diguanylate cyclase (GGDEF)-like protein
VLPIISLVAALAATALAIAWALSAGNAPGRGPFVAGLVGTLLWTATTLAQVMLPDVSDKILASELAWFGITLVPLGWAFSVAARIGLLPPTCPWGWRVSVLLAAAVCAVALTNDWHRAIYTGFNFISDAEGTEVVYHHGWLFWIVVGMSHAALAAGVVGALWAARGQVAVFRMQFVGLVVAMMLPWLLNLAGIFLGFGLWRVDPAPFAFSLTGLVLTGLMHKGDLFRLAPIAHRVVLEVLPDPVLVVDARRRVLEANRAAERLFGIQAMTVGRTLDAPASLVRHLDGPAPAAGKADLEVPEIDRVFEVASEPLDDRGRPGCRLLVMRDITERTAAEARLAAAGAALSLRLEQNIDLQRQLREEAQRDHQTGLFNRRHAQSLVPNLIASAKLGGDLAVLLIDLDHFKQFNDRFGHAAGDEALVAFAQALTRDLRPGEAAFRYGGEEFLVVLPKADRASAVACCARLRVLVAAKRLAAAPDCRLTFSAGVALLSDLAPDLDAEPVRLMETLIRAADVALYRAKISGRDRVVTWGDHLAGLGSAEGRALAS